MTTVWAAPAMVRAILDVPGIERARPLVGAGDHRRRREDADPAHRAAAARRSRRRGSPTRTASPRRCRATPSSTGRARVTKLGSVGRPCQYLELDIWDEHGRVAARGRAGRGRPARPEGVQGLLARSRRDERRRSPGGWFHTGDIGVLDDDGYLYIVDRLKDMIVSGGENIASSEVERVLYEHEAVVEAAVVGRPDDRWGEVPVAFVVVAPDAPTTPDELDRALPRPAREVQGPEGRGARRRAPAEPVGQGPQAGAATTLARPSRLSRQVRHEGGRPGHEVGRDGSSRSRR